MKWAVVLVIKMRKWSDSLRRLVMAASTSGSTAAAVRTGSALVWPSRYSSRGISGVNPLIAVSKDAHRSGRPPSQQHTMKRVETASKTPVSLIR